MNNWELIRNSSIENPYINILINGLETLIVKIDENPSFSLILREKEISNILFSTYEKETLKGRSMVPGGIEIGRFTLPDKYKSQGEWYFLKGCDRFRKHVEQSIHAFHKLVGYYKYWFSFSDYLKSEVIIDSESSIDKQAPFEYWWLTGEKESYSFIHETRLYDNKGVFIRPDDKKLPIFTSSMYAGMASLYYLQKYGVSLTPAHIFCPTCFLTGICALLGNGTITGGLLNDQWEIRFLTCSKLKYRAPCHFVISDIDGNTFELVGCMDTGVEPVWLTGVCAWDNSCDPTECFPVPWNTSSMN